MRIVWCFFLLRNLLTSSRVVSELCNPCVSNVTRLSADKLCCFWSVFNWPVDVWLSNALKRSDKGTLKEKKMKINFAFCF